jgi:hypothetical protein
MKIYRAGPSQETQLELKQPANVLQVSIVNLQLSESGPVQQVLLASTADRRLHYTSWGSTSANKMIVLGIEADSPILSFVTLLDRYIVVTTISGALLIYDPCTDGVVAKRKDHQKYAVQVVTTSRNGQTYLATAGWDSRVLLYALDYTDGMVTVSDPIAIIQLLSLPESLIFSIDARDEELYLIVARRDSTYLYYYHISSTAASTSTDLPLTGKQNLTPFATAWNSFSPACIAPCPTDSSLVAIATNSIPHMKVLLVRLLFPNPVEENSAPPAQLSAPISAAATGEAAGFRSQFTGAPAIGTGDVDPREIAAVLAHTNTNISQTRYSTPIVAWRPSGSGFWVNSEEGTIKGIDRTGKIQATLQGHEAGSKVRCLWAGSVSGESSGSEERMEEVLISGGFDQKLFAWRIVE